MRLLKRLLLWMKYSALRHDHNAIVKSLNALGERRAATHEFSMSEFDYLVAKERDVRSEMDKVQHQRRELHMTEHEKFMERDRLMDKWGEIFNG